MRKKLLVIFDFICAIIFSLGLSFMQYRMLNSTINLFMVLIGGIGFIALGIKIAKK